MKLTLLQPNPTHMERTLFGDEVSKARVLACAHYEDCLDQAVKANWLGWNCTRCPLRTPDIAAPDAFPAEEVVKEVTHQRGPHPTRNTGLAGRVWALFEERDTWEAAAVAKRLGCRPQQARDALRGLLHADRVRRSAPGIYERWE